MNNEPHTKANRVAQERKPSRKPSDGSQMWGEDAESNVLRIPCGGQRAL